LQTIVGVVDHGLGIREAVEAPRAHFEDGVLYAEPGVPDVELAGDARLGGEMRIVRFGARNLFFGGVQAAQREGERLSGWGDPRRGGVAVGV
jgi:gamma-glutamyltranspeptidase/glutathione hydrolase